MLSDERLKEMLAGTPPVSVRSILTELLSLREANAKMAEALEAALAWIDAVPADTPLPAMPGFVRDDVDAVLALHRGDAEAKIQIAKADAEGDQNG